MSRAKRGRPKGSRNKTTNEVKEAIMMVFEGIGGVQRMIEWVNKDDANETAFFTRILPRLLPRPALEPVPEPEALRPIRGAMTWKTPEWVKLLQRKGLLNTEVSTIASAVCEAAAAAPPGRTDGEVPLGEWEYDP